MSRRTVARRYANALYEEASETDALASVDENVLMLRRSLDSNDELARFFKSPVIPAEKKDAIIRELLEERVEALLVRFLRLLVAKDRETMTHDILDAYQTLRDEQRGILDVSVQVAQPLADADREALVEALEQKTGQSIRMEVVKNPDLIGGLLIRMDDRVFDASVRNQLHSLHERLRTSSLSLDVGDVNGQPA